MRRTASPTPHPVKRSISMFVALAGIIASTALLPAISALAMTTYLSESYSADSQIPMNSLVSLKSSASDQVVPSDSGTVDTMIGVVIDPSDASIAFTGGSKISVQVAKSGTLEVLVSTVNGAIEQGDYITASPIKGVGMRATGSTKVIGIAQKSLENGVDQKVDDGKGSQQTVKVGTVPVLVSVSGYIQESNDSFIPRPVQDVANTLAGRTVSSLPILLSIGVFIVTLVIVTIIIYSMVRNGIISVGRNPLSSSAIYRNIIQLSVLVLGILVGAGVIIYFILTRM